MQFASSAADVPGCVNLKLLNSPETVAKFADCLRSVAGAYRKGLDPNLTKKIGVDTNYVAAMEQAATHIPPDSKRPAMILFTDGKHDVKGVPASAVQPARNRLFGSRTPFALLPVGMGLDPKERGPLTAGLQALRITRDMPACTSGATFEWPTVAFDTPDKAGAAVAQALQDATCTFTVAPTPAPTPPPAPAAVRAVAATPLDGRIQLTWAAPATSPVAITDYLARCRSGDGDWVEFDGGHLDRAEHDHRGPDQRAALPVRGRDGRCHVAGPMGPGRHPRDADRATRGAGEALGRSARQGRPDQRPAGRPGGRVRLPLRVLERQRQPRGRSRSP